MPPAAKGTPDAPPDRAPDTPPRRTAAMMTPPAPDAPAGRPAAERAYHHGDLKHALIDAALALIAEHGTRGLSLREAARNTGVSHAAAYRHFASKESLLAAIAEQGFRELTAQMRAAAAASAGDPGALLAATGRAYVEYGVKHPEHLQVMFSGAIGDLAAHPELARVSAESYQVLADTVAVGLAAGVLRPNDPAQIALAAWSFVHGLSLLIAAGRVPAAADAGARAALLDAMLGMLRDGLAADR